ncbi:MAG: hypothetical protein IKU60_00240 [Clostridia bacterium]|nr:hypothetical protein [Clostridia bacterium]
MVPESVIKYPDYMMDFEEIDRLAAWQKVVMRSVNTSGSAMLEEKTMDNFSDSTSYWENFVPSLKNMNTMKVMNIMHKKHTLTTFDVLYGYVSGIIRDSFFTMEYDEEAATIRIRAKQYQYDTKAEKLIRRLLPFHLLLDFQEVEELG